MFDDTFSLALNWSTVILAIAIVAVLFRMGFPPPAIGGPPVDENGIAEAVDLEDEDAAGDVFEAVFQNILDLPPIEGNFVPPPVQGELLAEE